MRPELAVLAVLVAMLETVTTLALEAMGVRVELAVTAVLAGALGGGAGWGWGGGTEGSAAIRQR